MEIIPYSVHLPALIGLVLYAVIRPSLFPLVLTGAYVAFFHITFLFESTDLIGQIIIQSTLTSMLISITITCGKEVRYASRFSLCMLLGILNLFLINSTSGLEDGYYLAAQVSTAGLTYTLNIFEYYFLLRMIHDARGNRIDKIITDWCLASLRNFKPSNSAIPFHNQQTESER